MREQIGKQNLHKYAGSSDESMTKLSSAALSSVTSAGSVETFPLVRPSSTNKFEGVYIYLDEVGMLKHVSSSITFRLGRTNSENEQLPSNSRASKLAAQCGYSPAPNCEYMIPNLRWVVVLALTPRNLTRTAVYGDVFVGRVKSRPAMRNVDIDTEDIVDTSRGEFRSSVK